VPPIGEITTVEFAGIKQQRRRTNERIVPENLTADDGWSHRGTFAGDAAAFMAVERAGVAGDRSCITNEKPAQRRGLSRFCYVEKFPPGERPNGLAESRKRPTIGRGNCQRARNR
jgi:hypothetical protein